MEPIVLTNYNLDEAEKVVITSCLKNVKNKTLKEHAEILHINERTLYRKIKKYKIKHEKTPHYIEKAINMLKKKGYNIQEPKK